MAKTCVQCETTISDTVLICPSCGHRTNQSALTNTPSCTGVRAASVALPSLAGFFPRVGAFLIDFMIVSLLALPLMLAFPFFASLFVWWLYCSLMESSKSQATLGKKAFGLRVTDVNGARILFGRASTRFFGKFLCTATLGLGFLIVLRTQNKQGLHDMVSGCLVYRWPKQT